MSFQDLWPQIREKFPPARAVVVLVGFGAPLVGIVNAWIANHAPLIAEQVGPQEMFGVWAGTVAALVALGYKWLDGRAKWEAGQVNAHVELAKQGLNPSDLPSGVLEPPPAPSDTNLTGEDGYGGLDDDALLSQPDDIAESDIDDPDAAERRERFPDAE